MITAFFQRHPAIRDKSLIFLSAVLLIAAFPRVNWWLCAWVGLVPFFLVLDGKSAAASFRLGYLAGILFFIGTLYWFIYVTFLGAFLLIAYLALYFGVFALFYRIFCGRSMPAKLILLPSAWVALEYIRSHALTGFGWAGLGQSQYQNLPFIQIADITGMYGVSFIVVMANALLKECIACVREGKKEVLRKRLLVPGVVVAGIVLACYGYGRYRLAPGTAPSRAKVAVVQGNIRQELKWMPSARPLIMKRYQSLTRQAAVEKPDVIIWPETAFPGYRWEIPALFEQLKDFVAEIRIPLLVGLVDYQEDADTYYNAAVLISRDGKVIEQHNKLHLVPFGEYIPLRKMLPFLSGIVPIGDFTPGARHTLFPVGSEKYFSVLICFEDTPAYIARAFTRAGTNLLVNITNDAWFQDTKAPFLHMASSVFRTVENRRGLVRAANTGVSCIIDPQGRIVQYVQDSTEKKTYVSGYTVASVALQDEQTFYTKYGDIFTYVCFGSILMGMVRRRWFISLRAHKRQ